MEKILDEVEETIFENDDEALAFFERKYKEAKEKRHFSFKVRERKVDKEPMFEKILDHEMNPMEL